MDINLNELSYKNRIDIDIDVLFPKNYFENSVIKDLKNVHADGYLYQNSTDEYCANLKVSGTMIILDTVTLNKIDYDFSFDYDDILEENVLKNKNTLDIIELLWQNIVLEVPIRCTKTDADNLSGDNWQVKSDAQREKEIDPRMAKLYDLYKGGE